MAQTEDDDYSARCGENIKLSAKSTVARRTEDEWCDAVVLIEQPVALDTIFQVEMTQV